MTKKELVEVVASKAGLARAEAERAFGAMIEVIVKEAKKGEIRVDGLGTFKVAKRAARVAKNPRTGAVVKVPAKKVVVFKAAKALKDF